MPNKIKLKIADEMAGVFSKVNHCVFANYKGVSAAQINDLRSNLRGKNLKMKVIKNSTAVKALEQAGKKQFAGLPSGQTAIFYGADDPVVISKEVITWGDKHKLLKVLGGFSDGALLSQKDVVVLSKMPSKEVMIAMLLGTLNAPCTNFVGVLSAVTRNLAYALKEIEKAKSSS